MSGSSGRKAAQSVFNTKQWMSPIVASAGRRRRLNTTAYIKQPGPATTAAPPLIRRSTGMDNSRQTSSQTSSSNFELRPTTTSGRSASQKRTVSTGSSGDGESSNSASSRARFSAGVGSVRSR